MQHGLKKRMDNILAGERVILRSFSTTPLLERMR